MGLMQTLLLSCRKAAELIEQQSFAPLPAGQKVQLWMHTRICAGCRTFQHQNELIDTLLEGRVAEPMAMPTAPLEQRIIAAIDNHN